MATPFEALTTMLISMGIAGGPAEGYAVALAEDGFDTETAFNTLSIEELRDDFGFKRGHLRMVEHSRAAVLGDPPRGDAPRRDAPLQAVAITPAALGASDPVDEESHQLPPVVPQDIVDDPFAWETVDLAQQGRFEEDYEYSLVVDTNRYWIEGGRCHHCRGAFPAKQKKHNRLRCGHEFAYRGIPVGGFLDKCSLDKCTMDKFLDYLGTEPGDVYSGSDLAPPPGVAELVKHVPGTKTGVKRLRFDSPGLTVLKHLVQKAKPVRFVGNVDSNGHLVGVGEFKSYGTSGMGPAICRVAYYARYMADGNQLVLSIVRRKLKLPYGEQQSSKGGSTLIRFIEQREAAKREVAKTEQREAAKRKVAKAEQREAAEAAADYTYEMRPGTVPQ